MMTSYNFKTDWSQNQTHILTTSYWTFAVNTNCSFSNMKSIYWSFFQMGSYKGAFKHSQRNEGRIVPSLGPFYASSTYFFFLLQRWIMLACGLTCKSPNQFSLFLLIVALVNVVVVVVAVVVFRYKWANKNKNMLPSKTLLTFDSGIAVQRKCFYTPPTSLKIDKEMMS